MVVLMPSVQAVVISDMWKNACGRSALLSKFSESVQTGTAYYWPASQFPPNIHRQFIYTNRCSTSGASHEALEWNRAGTSVKALEAIARLGRAAPRLKLEKNGKPSSRWPSGVSKTYREKQ